MRAWVLRFLVPAAVCLALSGCGGSSSGSGGGGGGGGGGGNTPTTVTVSFAGTPTALATQVGSGSFTAATLTSGTLTLSIPSGTTNFAVAYLCGDDGYTQQTVIEASTLDGTSYSASYCPSLATQPTGTLTGSADASAIAGAEFVGINAYNGSGYSESVLLTGDSGPINFALPSGTDRLAATAYTAAPSNPLTFNSVETLLAVRNFDSVTIPGALNGGNTVTLGAADEVTMQPITYKNVPSGFAAPTTTAYYEWSGGGELLLSNGATTQYPAIPAAAGEGGDYYSFGAVTEMSTNGGATEAGVAASTITTASGPLTFTFPAPWIYAGPTPSAQPVFNMANSGITGKTGVMDYVTMAWNISAAGETNSALFATANYLNGSTSVAIPNLTGVSGFLSGPPSGGTVVWFADVEQSTAASLQPLNQNGTLVDVESGGSFTVP
jgi:hypothetical protein